MKCETCKYWAEISDSGRGNCRIHAPVMCGTSEIGYTKWPETSHREGCGEHEPKESTDE